jgi:hypothetical protein
MLLTPVIFIHSSFLFRKKKIQGELHPHDLSELLSEMMKDKFSTWLEDEKEYDEVSVP